MALITLAVFAMRTRFELVLRGDINNALRLHAAGEEALAEIIAVERALSAYDRSSEIFALNQHAHKSPMRVSMLTIEFLTHCQRLSEQTQQQFDPTIGPLFQLWFSSSERRSEPTEAEISAARELIGMQHVLIDREDQTVVFAKHGVRLDPGAIGKGFALDRAAALLLENDLTDFLLHGGTSSVIASGENWEVALPDGRPLTLDRAALGVSAPTQRSTRFGDYSHIIDPSSGRPVPTRAWAAVVAPSATDADALSTALLLKSRAGEAAPGIEFYLPKDGT
jgi:FAD:protein FMN transferase